LTVFPVYLGLARRAALLRVQSRAAPSFRLGKRDYHNRGYQLHRRQDEPCDTSSRSSNTPLGVLLGLLQS
jgi:hypothetical protein